MTEKDSNTFMVGIMYIKKWNVQKFVFHQIKMCIGNYSIKDEENTNEL